MITKRYAGNGRDELLLVRGGDRWQVLTSEGIRRMLEGSRFGTHARDFAHFFGRVYGHKFF